MIDWRTVGVVAAVAWGGMLLALGVRGISHAAPPSRRGRERSGGWAPISKPSLRLCVSALKHKPLSALVFFVCAVIATVEAQKQGRLRVENGELRIEMSRGEAATAILNSQLSTLNSPRSVGAPVSPDDIARGWRVESVTTAAAPQASLPSNAVHFAPWTLRGGREAWFPLDLGGFSFPLGSNSVRRLRVLSGGMIETFAPDAPAAICAARDCASLIPGRSRFHWADADEGAAKILRWEGVFAGRDRTGEYDAQITLYANGDFTTRSNDVETVCRRINPDDWDGDGFANEKDANPLSPDGDFFGAANELPEGANAAAYCTVSVVATGPDALIRFIGDKPGNYPDPCFIAKSGVTNDVVVLIGKTYAISSDWPFEVVGASDPATEVWQMRHAAHQTFVRRPVSFTSSGGNPFTMAVLPANLGGAFAWQSPSCSCVLSGGGGTFGWSCPADCTCCGCTVDGMYVYEGYWLPVASCPCGCLYDGTGPTWEPVAASLAASVAASFSKSAVIFEDAYENLPGQWVGKRSTRTRLNIVACGGPSGGTLTVASSNLAKLTHLSGPDLPFAPVAVPASTQVSYSVVYEGNEASAAADDIIVTATLTDAGTGEAWTNDCALTAVRLELTPVWAAPENPCTNRHVYGVGERVRVRTFPESATTILDVTRINEDESWLYDNIVDFDERIYACPIYTATPNLKVTYREAEYNPSMTIIEPSEVISRGVGWDAYNAPCLLPGLVGGALLVITNYVGPMNVSFHGIMVSEIPCAHTNMPSGFFATTNYTGRWTHSFVFDDGWGMATRVGTNNYWTVDRAGHSGTYDNWSAGRLVWDVPIGWFRMRFDGDDRHGVAETEHACNSNAATRPLLIGGAPNAYQQVFSISEDGTVSIEKHGHALSRSRYCRILLDGQTIQWMHGL